MAVPRERKSKKPIADRRGCAILMKGGEKMLKILIEDYNGVGKHLYECEKCGFIALYHEGTEPKICPDCGAEMTTLTKEEATN